MRQKYEHPRDCNCLGRRNFLKMAGSATALGLAGAGGFVTPAYADALTKAQRDNMRPDQIIQAMKNGN